MTTMKVLLMVVLLALVDFEVVRSDEAGEVTAFEGPARPHKGEKEREKNFLDKLKLGCCFNKDFLVAAQCSSIQKNSIHHSVFVSS